MNGLFDFSVEERKYLTRLDNEHESILSPYATKNNQAIRKTSSSYADPARGNYAIDIDRILHSAFFNRSSDKTQVFSFFHNDDVTRRMTHIQFVSRIARIIGRALRLNLDLIEAIAIGHDIGHAPFGHKGEKFLNDLFFENTGRYFNHNVHGVRVLRDITNTNLTLQTLDGILCHNGEEAFIKYAPARLESFEEFDELMERCYTELEAIKSLRPSTLEGCVVRISDIIAYLGKDRQDAKKLKFPDPVRGYGKRVTGNTNRNIISNVVRNVIKNSIERDYIGMDKEVYDDIESMRKENNDLIYQRKEITYIYCKVVNPMMKRLYYKFKEDFENRKSKGFGSPLFKHYLNSSAVKKFYQPGTQGGHFDEKISSDEIVTDYIASMTDDYFVDVYEFVFGENPLKESDGYIKYFDKRYI